MPFCGHKSIRTHLCSGRFYLPPSAKVLCEKARDTRGALFCSTTLDTPWYLSSLDSIHTLHRRALPAKLEIFLRFSSTDFFIKLSKIPFQVQWALSATSLGPPIGRTAQMCRGWSNSWIMSSHDFTASGQSSRKPRHQAFMSPIVTLVATENKEEQSSVAFCSPAKSLTFSDLMENQTH